jgi:transcriptional regulator with XRE-family HTH domain
MPRRSTFGHPLRAIRGATGLSQARFGRLVGVTAHTIESIENGRLPLSERLAREIQFATGADAAELMKGVTGKPLNSRGKRFTGDDYQWWLLKYGQNTRESADSLASDISEEIAQLYRRAAKQNRLPQVHRSLRAAVETCNAAALKSGEGDDF